MQEEHGGKVVTTMEIVLNGVGVDLIAKSAMTVTVFIHKKTTIGLIIIGINHAIHTQLLMEIHGDAQKLQIFGSVVVVVMEVANSITMAITIAKVIFLNSSKRFRLWYLYYILA